MTKRLQHDFSNAMNSDELIELERNKLLGETLADAELRFEAVVESLAEGVAIFDRAGVLQYCNSLFEQLTGYTRHEMYGKRIFEIFFPPGSPEQQEYFEHMLRRYRARKEGAYEVYESHIYRKNGERRWVLTKAGPFVDVHGRIIGSIGANTDITEQKKLEEQLRWSQKMEAVGRVAGGVAHDFNNFLTVISGYSEMMLRHMDPADPNRARIETISQSAAAACRLTKQLLTLSRRTVVQKELFSINEVVDDTLDIIRGLVGEEVEICLDLADDLPPINADRAQLQQVLVNLVINARDAIKEGGKVYLRTRREALSQRTITSFASMAPGEYVILTVEDTGHGMDSEVLSSLFEPFFTTKKRSGTGLGLSTSYAIIKQHLGDILVDSTPGSGSTFEVYLPASQRSQQPIRAHRAVTEPSSGNETILVVEDEPAVRKLAVEVLRENGYTIVQAADGTEALKLLERSAASINLMVSDVVMPQMNGFTLAQQVRQAYPGLHVLLMSGYTDDVAVAEKIGRLGAPFLPKPFLPSDLLQAVRSVLDGKAAVS